MKRTAQNSFWAKHFNAQAKSGLSADEYTKKNRISLNKWYYWRKKVNAKPNVDIVKEPFAQVVIKSKPIRQSAHMALKIAGQFELIFDEQISPEQLAEIVKCLRGVAL